MQFIPVVVALILAAWSLTAAHAQPRTDGVTTTVTIIGPNSPAQSTASAVQRAACIKVRTVTDLDNIRNDLAGNYCLANDIDASSVANFTPIGDSGTPFAGTLDGRGHIIRGLTINSFLFNTGLFGVIGSGGVVKNLGLLDARVTSTNTNARVGALAGRSAGSIIRSYVTGAVERTAGSGTAGGLVGIAATGGSVTQSSSAASVISVGASSVGGLVGDNAAPITLSYSTGSVRGGDNSNVGGLVGSNVAAAVAQSFATGSVQGGASSIVGGLVGIAADGSASQTLATGPVNGGAFSRVGGLVGSVATFGGTSAITQSYAAGRVTGDTGGTGGLVGNVSGTTTITKSYWDGQTSGQSASAGGKRRTTAQLQAGLPSGFAAAKWSITPGVSYPILTAATLNFASPLATTVVGKRIYTFLPISQLDPAQYLAPPAHADGASRATVFTMLARAIGIAKNVAKLTDVAIDEFFWVDATQKTFFRGPVKKHATLGAVTTIPNAQPIDDDNIVGALKARNVVAIRGRFQKAGGETGTHWMLATSFTVDVGGGFTALIADDPWTGQQVRIDPTSKAITLPPNFPLDGFKVNGFQVIALN